MLPRLDLCAYRFISLTSAQSSDRLSARASFQIVCDLPCFFGISRLLMFTHLRKEKALVSFIIAQSMGKSRQYVHAEDLDTTRAILAEKYPAYLPAFDRVMACSAGHRFNMFVIRKRYFDRWCAFLFDVPFELEQRLDISGYSPYDARVFGFVGERLLDVWLRTNRVRYRDLPYVFMERQNWLTKGGRFVLRKLRGSK